MKKFKISKFFKKKIINQKFQFHEKIQDFQNFQKKKKKKNHQSNFFKFLQKFKISKIFKKQKFKIFNSFEKFKFSKFKKKKSSLNFSSRTKSYDPLPYFLVVQHQVNCPPSAFFKAWSMSQTRGIRQVCRIQFQ